MKCDALEISFLRNSFHDIFIDLIEQFGNLQSSFIRQNSEPLDQNIDNLFTQQNKILSLFKKKVDDFLRNFFEIIPSELVAHIFSFISSLSQLRQLSFVCKSFHLIIKDNSQLWKNGCLQWWEEKRFTGVQLNWIFDQTNKVAVRDWKWFAKCFLAENQNLSFKVDIKEREDGDWISFGQLTEGKLEGWGIDVNLNGSVLEIGTFKDGILEGEGLCACSDGDQYIGHFKHGLNDGFGKKTWADGKSYEGEWRKGMRHGKGKMVWPKGGYEWFGEWENDTPQGIEFKKNS
jgi:hypothetical protein